ncbi:MAG TPA: LPS export ABC transporter permease LptF [Cellvibrionaceae bacterium]
MILFRYLAREMLQSMAAVSLVLLLVILSGRFVRYLAEAASGKLDAGVVFTLLSFRLPGYLELILPLGLFIAILLAYGRLYIDSEMTVLSACGVSEGTILRYSLVCGLAVAAVVAFFSLYLSPVGARAAESLLAAQRNRTEFETLKPGRFHRLSNSAGVAYVQGVDEGGKTLRNVFLAGKDEGSDALSVMTAKTGYTITDDKSAKRFLVLGQGVQYRGSPGQANYEEVEFATYQQYVPQPAVDAKPKKFSDMLSTFQLLKATDKEAKATLQWRLSMPVLVLIVVALSVPLARTQPRTGRYAKLIPAILLYVVYLVLANAARGAMETGKNSLPFLLWWVHGAFALLAWVLFDPKRLLFWKVAK